MNDKYFFTGETRDILLAALGLLTNGQPAEGVVTGCAGNYFENPTFILYWVGKIPKTFDENGAPLTYEADGADHFNVRPISDYPDFGALNVTEVEPLTPYTAFA